MFWITPKLNQSFFVFCIQSKENVLPKKSFLKRSENGRLKKKENKPF